MNDETAIRELQQKWFEATMAGDVETVSELMTDDVVFLTCGRPPFGRQQFIETFEAMKEQVAMKCNGEYEEIIVCGEMAYARARLDVKITPKSGSDSKHLSGYAMSILRRSEDGTWRLCRDANLLSPATD